MTSPDPTRWTPAADVEDRPAANAARRPRRWTPARVALAGVVGVLALCGVAWLHDLGIWLYRVRRNQETQRECERLCAARPDRDTCAYLCTLDPSRWPQTSPPILDRIARWYAGQ